MTFFNGYDVQQAVRAESHATPFIGHRTGKGTHRFRSTGVHLWDGTHWQSATWFDGNLDDKSDAGWRGWKSERKLIDANPNHRWGRPRKQKLACWVDLNHVSADLIKRADMIEGVPCSWQRYSDWGDACANLANGDDGMCKTHAAHTRRREANHAEYTARVDANREHHRREEQLSQAARETLDRVLPILIEMGYRKEQFTIVRGVINVSHESFGSIVDTAAGRWS